MMYHLFSIFLCLFIISRVSHGNFDQLSRRASPEHGIDHLTDLEIANYCCYQGSEFGKLKTAATCSVRDIYSAKVPRGDLPKPEIPRRKSRRIKESCEQSFEDCCKAELYAFACEEGRQVAWRGSSCPEAVIGYGDAYKNSAMDCCIACSSGKDIARKKRSCDHNPGINSDYDAMFRKCCNDEIVNLAANPVVKQRRPVLRPVYDKVRKGHHRITKCSSNTVCHHLCKESPVEGLPVECSCRTGYVLNRDGRSCDDINECETIKCPSSKVCINRPGSYDCITLSIPEYEGPARRDGVESSSGLPFFMPLRADGRCPTGYKPDLEDESRCLDMNECEEGDGEVECSRSGFACQNTWGKFICIPIYPKNMNRRVDGRLVDLCSPGLRLDENGQCIDIDECAIGNHHCNLQEENCENKIGNYVCKKKPDALEVETNECGDSLVFQPGQGCVPPYDIACPRGFKWNKLNSRCEDIDECSAGQTCQPGHKCVNKQGSYSCDAITCSEDEYPTVEGCKKRCLPTEQWDADESVCKRKRINCPRGFDFDEQFGRCKDVDECRLNKNICSANQFCQNTPGSYECVCESGYSRDSATDECFDIDECSVSSHICPDNAQCVNRVGSYECTCKSGFQRLSPTGPCLDINECSTSDHKCSATQKCQNTVGSYVCQCSPGYREDPFDPSKCVDVNECTEYISATGNAYINSNNRTCQFKCENTPGSFKCSCPDGYTLDPETNRTCVDIDECENSSCPGESICVNTHGSYECFDLKCPEGYSPEPNEFRCKRDSFDCDVNDHLSCVSKPSHYTFHYLTFPSNLKLIDNRLQIFGITFGFPEADVMYDFTISSLSSAANVPIVHEKYFDFEKKNNDLLFYVKRPIIGPQTFEVTFNVQIYHRSKLTATHVVRTIIVVSEYEF